MEKIKAYVGFAKKSRSIVYGVDDIVRSQASKIIVVSQSLGKSSLNQVKKFAESKNIELFVIYESTMTAITSENVKAFSITDVGLASACAKILKSEVGGKIE